MLRYLVIAGLLVLLLFFIGLNLDNRATVTILFFTFTNVPVFFVAMIGFVLGFGSALPLVLRGKGPGQGKRSARAASPVAESSEGRPT